LVTVALAAAVLVIGGGSATASAPAFSFQAQQFQLPDGFTTVRGMTVGDLDGINGPDVVILGFGGNLAIFLNDGSGGFQPAEFIAGGCTTDGEVAGVAIGSFSTSGHPDLLVACGDAINGGFLRYQGNGDGTFQAAERAAPIQGYYGEDNQRHPIYVGNIIQNMVHGPFGGLPSIVWTEWIAGGSGQYMICTLPDEYFASDFGATECSIDVDNNGVVQGFLEFPPPLVLGTEPVASPSDWAFTNAPADAGLDNGSLLGAVHDGNPPPPLHSGFFSDNFEPPTDVPGSPYPLIAGDLNGDGSSEIISGYAGANADQIAVYQLTGTDNAGTILINQPQLFNTNPAMDGYDAAVVGDFDGDGNPDVAVLGTSFASDCCEQLQVFPGDGTASLGAPQEFNIADFTTESYLATADFNGDSLPDLVTTIGNGGGQTVMDVLYNTPATPHTLTVSKSGPGSGSVTSIPTGIDCGATCSADFGPGTHVTLTATPIPGDLFDGWSGGGCSGTGTCEVNLNADTTVTADFDRLPPDTQITKATISSKKGRATFKFVAIGDATDGFQCALKRPGKVASFKACSSPKHYRALRTGHYTFEVRAVNNGLPDPTPAKKKFKIKR
jgi:List-Bact-rpt repeat protein/VCBS repeat protein